MPADHPHPDPTDDDDLDAPAAEPARIQEATRWSDGTWIAQVLKNEDGDGWAVAMTLVGMSEPALVGPWTMGRDKKNPKPLDTPAFHTLVKTANEVIRRHEQQREAQLRKRATAVAEDGQRLTIQLDITPDDEHPSARLSAWDEGGDEVAAVAVRPDFALNPRSAQAWVDAGFARPR